METKERSVCSVADCDRKYWAKGFCCLHLHRFQRHGDPLWGGAPRISGLKPCAFPGCLKTALARTFCKKHYRALMAHGDPGAERAVRRDKGRPKIVPRLCSEVGCGERVIARELCRRHWRRWRRRQDPPKVRKPHPSKTCAIEGCERRASSEGYCEGHRQRFKVTGSYGGPVFLATGRSWRPPTCTRADCSSESVAIGLCRDHYLELVHRGVPSPALADGLGYVGDEGYVSVHAPVGSPYASRNGRVQEHRLIVALLLGRPLLKSENVHHKNGVRSDNRRENLELWVKAQPPGQRVEDVLAWAREIVARYSSEVEVLDLKLAS